MDTFRQQIPSPIEEAGDLAAPFSQRVMIPTIAGLARLATSILPGSWLTSIEKSLVMAGRPMSLNGFAAMWVAMTLAFGGGALFAVTFIGSALGVLQGLLVVLVLGGVGFLFPSVWLKGRVRGRQRLIVRAMPDALDLITTCVEAGLGLDAALARVVEKGSGPLVDELSHTLREVVMGRRRRDALTDMAQRTGAEDLISFINSIVQAEQLGVSIAQVLRVQADQMRMRRRQRAEQSAREAPVKMLFPLVFFIFPALLVAILGPAVINIGRSALFD
jgi:tight adherence protein C